MRKCAAANALTRASRRDLNRSLVGGELRMSENAAPIHGFLDQVFLEKKLRLLPQMLNVA